MESDAAWVGDKKQRGDSVGKWYVANQAQKSHVPTWWTT